MPRQPRPPRLWLRPADKASRRGAVWIILDAGRQISTGCGAEDRAGAERALAAHLAGKHQAPRRRRDIDAIPVADVIALYLTDVVAGTATAPKTAARCARLIEWWGERCLADVTAGACRDYAAWRAALPVRGARKGGRAEAGGGARRDLEDLRAAIGHHLAEGYHREIVRVWLPAKGAPRLRWLTRAEAARLLWVCWRTREMQTRHRGGDPGPALPTAKYPLRHLARFVLLGLYTGTRAGAIATASWAASAGRSYIDLDQGTFYRLAIGARQTNKRQPPAPLPPRLLAHLRRWHTSDSRIASQIAGRETLATGYVVEWHGDPVRSVKTAFARACRLAGIEGATPHTLRHTAATWAMQGGAPIWQAAGYLGMSEKTLRDTYAHHHPHHMAETMAAITAAPARQRRGNG
ncbi:MAG: site-specific integrase [Hyphomicrobiaceae bacterium]|nr:site-specific integrase [Hyphomicrobiaceae bacterium]